MLSNKRQVYVLVLFGSLLWMEGVSAQTGSAGRESSERRIRSSEEPAFRRVRQTRVGESERAGSRDRIRNALRARGMSDEEIERQLERLGLVEATPDSLMFEEGALILEPTRTRLDSLRLALLHMQEEELLKRQEMETEISILEQELGVEEEEAELVPLSHFGHDFFEYRPQVYDAISFGRVSPAYILGPDDELFFQMWGDTRDEYTLRVDRNGAIYLDQVGRVYVNGLTLDDLRKRLAVTLKKVHSGISLDGRGGTTFFDISLGKLRTIRVDVVGAVKNPGPYYIPGMSSVVTALQFADGLRPEGSLRTVKIIRDNQEIVTIDMYEFLIDGIKPREFYLQDGDVVVVPPVTKEIVVTGALRREPQIYELVADETLEDVVTLAGGLSPRAHAGGIQIWRYVATNTGAGTISDREILQVNFHDPASRLTVLRDGDSLHVAPLVEDARNYVYIEGRVRRPGLKALYEGMTLRDLIRRAEGVEEDAYLERAQLFRVVNDTTRVLISLDLQEYLNPDRDIDLPLQKRDSIHVYSMSTFVETPIVTIYGEVREIGEYEYYIGMTVTDLVFQAGGLREEAYTKTAEISRLRTAITARSIALLDTFFVPLQSGYRVNDYMGFQLQPYDNVFIRRNPDWELQRNVEISGEVRFPGTYSLESREVRLLSLIERTGGFTDRAQPEAIEFVRTQENIGRIPIYIDKAIGDPTGVDNLILFDGDQIHVPELRHIVRVEGEVGFPTSVLYQKGRGVGYYITNAGGYTEDSDTGRIKIILASGQIARPRKFWFDTDITPGSSIIVPRKADREPVNVTEVVASGVQIISGLVTTIFILTRTF